MKKLLLILLVVVLLVSGCAEKDVVEEKTVKKVTTPTVKQTELPAEEIPEKETTKATGPALSAEIKAIMAKADTVTSLEYSHAEFIEGEAGYYAHVEYKDGKARHEVEIGSGEFARGMQYDTVYLDIAAKTAVGYCEDEYCDDKDNAVDVDFDDFKSETPFDVLDDLKYGTRVGTAMVEGRETVKVKYQLGSLDVNVWVWEYKGLPLKYEVLNGKEIVRKVEFKGLVINDVEDEDVVH